MSFAARQKQLRNALAESRLDAILITHLPNIRYLCGFTGSSGALWVSSSSAVFFSDSRYTEQARAEVQGAKVVIHRKALLSAVAEWALRKHRGSRQVLGVEGEHLSMAVAQNLAKLLAGKYRLRACPPLVERARMIKDVDEIRAIREAVDLGAALFDEALGAIRPGATELEVAAAVELAARRGGAEAMSFETIVAAGRRSALPHGRASEARIGAPGFVVCDFGVILHGYCSDRTRTVWVGRESSEARKTYEAVLEAQAAAISAVRPGATASEVDGAARKVLKKRKLAQYFTHSTGHGVGLEVHEAPRIASGMKEVLRPGMVITIEPGVYLSGKWGIRIEDMILVTEKGCEVLKPGAKEFIAV